MLSNSGDCWLIYFYTTPIAVVLYNYNNSKTVLDWFAKNNNEYKRNELSCKKIPILFQEDLLTESIKSVEWGHTSNSRILHKNGEQTMKSFDTQASQAIPLFKEIANSDNFREMMKIQGQILHTVMRQYELAGFSHEEAFEITKHRSSELKVEMS